MKDVKLKGSAAAVGEKMGAVEPIKTDDVTVSTDNKDIAATSQVKEQDIPKCAINTKKVATLVGGADSAQGIGSVLRAGAISYGGASDVSGDASARTAGTDVRKSGGRSERKVDYAVQHVNDVPAESFIVGIDTIPSIKEEGSIGYNGSYRNEHAITQKGAGGSPAVSNFFRTMDEMQYDNLYFTEGQYNVVGNSGKKNISVYDENSVSSRKTISLGNYFVKGLNVEYTVTADNTYTLNDVAFEVEDLTNPLIHEAEYRLAGDTELRESNIAELDRLAMVEKHSDETKDTWSPLAKVIPQSTDTNRFLKELDYCAGDMIYAAVTKAKESLAYQINKSAKDGMRLTGPIFEMCEGNIVDGVRNQRFASNDNQNIQGNLFSPDKYVVGSAALYVAMHDSTTKYDTKGKFLTLPLSFKGAIANADMNFKKIKMHKNFFDEFQKQEVFGKLLDNGTDLTPTFISDGAGLILPLDMSSQAVTGFSKPVYSKNNGASGTTWSDASVNSVVETKYEDLRNEYNDYHYNWFMAGLVKYFTRNADKIIDKCPGVGYAIDGTAVADGYTYAANTASAKTTGARIIRLSIPAVNTATCLSLYDLIICDAAKDIMIAREKMRGLVHDFEVQQGYYPYSGYYEFDGNDAGSFTNFGFSSISEPLKQSPITGAPAVRLLMPEIFQLVSAAQTTEKTALLAPDPEYRVGRVILPWYFNQNQYQMKSKASGKAANTWVIDPETGSSMTFFDFRGGFRLDQADYVFKQDPEKVKLALDRMVQAPGFNDKQTGLFAASDIKLDNDLTTDCHVYKYGYHEDGIPIFLYNIWAKQAANYANCLTIKDVLITPRELGLSMIAPAGICTPTCEIYDVTKRRNTYRKMSSGYFVTSGPSFRIRKWYAASAQPGALFTDVLSKFNGANMMANWDVIGCDSEANNAYDFGLKLANTGSASINPFVKVTSNPSYNYTTGAYGSGETAVTDYEVRSNLKYLYTRLHYLPFVINPWDCYYPNVGGASLEVDEWTPMAREDLFDYLHLFNMCGFRCGEYQQLEYDRNEARIRLGMNYVSDPYMERR